MPAKIIFTITKGNSQQNEYEYTQKESLIIGRDGICHINFRETTVSRRHCLIDLAPPYIRVRDFGSLNGTYLNGKIIGQRKPNTPPQTDGIAFNDFEVKSGDRLGIGNDCEITVKISQEIKDGKVTCELCGKEIRGADNSGICVDCKNNRSAIIDRVMAAIPGYKAIRVLGAGGMGEVWLVEEENTGNQMALKVMLPNVSVDEESRLMFLREAMIGEQLVNENIVRQYKFGKTGGDIYFILMEYCSGGSLDQYMDRTGAPVETDAATDIILQTLKGLHHAHNARIRMKFADGSAQNVIGVVHRDFKPGNIFITGESDKIIAKVADFGLAKAFEISGQYGLTRTGYTAGTPFYMPKQQVIDYKYARPDVDVWAAAATYYYMLTGHPPKNFDGRDMFLDALQNPAAPILSRNPRIPPKLAEVIDYALREDPQIGVQTAIELHDMIKGAF